MKNFKTFFAFMMLAVASFTMVACSEKDDPAPEPEPEIDVTIDIQVTDINLRGAFITVIPSRDDVAYFWSITDKERFESLFGGSAVACVEEYINHAAEFEDMSIPEVVEHRGFFGEFSGDMNILQPDTEYVAVAVPFSSDGKALSEGTVAGFKTLAEGEESVWKFEIEVTDVTSSGVSFTVTPSRDDTPYFWAVANKELFEKNWRNSTVDFIESWIYADAEEMGISTAEVVERYALFGEDSVTVEKGLNSDTECIVFAVPLSSDGKALASGDIVGFKTLAEGEESDMTFEIEVTDITSTGATVSVTPSRDDIYYYSEVAPKELFEAEYGSDFAAFVEARFTWYDEIYPDYTIEDLVQLLAKKGEYSNIHSDFTPDTEYVVFTVPVSSDGKALSEGELVTFRTLAE